LPVQLNHTIVAAHDADAAGAQFAALFGLPAPARWGPFVAVSLDNAMTLDFMTVEGDVVGQHYAFLVTETEFDEIFGRIEAQGIDFWADPHQQHPGEINHDDGGRGVYWISPDGHFLEIITRPYGGW
jgi:hypothetical protein